MIKVFAESADSTYWAEQLSTSLGREFTGVESVDDANLIVFTGGADVHPFVYDRGRHVVDPLRYDGQRDEYCIRLATQAVENNIYMLGVCRGSQFLTAMFGGYLHQHIDGHTGRHDLTYNSKVYSVTSTHHQATKDLAKGAKLLAQANDGIVEAYHIPDKQTLGIQSHPEFEYEYDEYNTMGLLRQIVTDIDFLGDMK